MPTPSAPEMPGAAYAYGNVGTPFTYLISASNSPVTFTARGLPAGLHIDARTGLITGTPSKTGEATVMIAASNATATASGTLTVAVGTPPPAPWSNQDIGDYVLDERRLGAYGVVSVRVPGITSYDAGDMSFTVRGAGTDLNVNRQGMTAQFAYRPVAGDSTFTARVVSLAKAGTSDQVGLLMAQSLSPFGQIAGAVLTSTGLGDAGIRQFVRRQVVAGTTSTTDGGSGVATPTWLRLQRSGNTFTAASSVDGSTWSVIGQDTILAFGAAPYYVGLVVTSRSPLALNTTVFDNITVTYP
jgi:hypothetical protein